MATALVFGVLLSCGDAADLSFSESLCSHCQIDIARAVRLDAGSRDARFLISTKLAKSDDGRFFAAPLVEPARVASFSPRGEYLLTFGARGSGPGEMDEVASLTLGREDSVFVLDGTGRLSVFAPAGEFARALETGVFGAVREAVSGDLILTDGMLGGGIWHVTRDGANRRRIDQSSQPAESRVVQIADDGRIWSVSSNYVIEVYSESAELLRTVDLSDFVGATDERYSTRVVDVTISAGDLLMVLVGRRDRQWRRPQQTERGEDGPVMLSVEEATQLHQYYLDIVDPWQVRIVARRKLEGMFVAGFLGTDQLYSVESDERYELSLQIWNVSFSLPPPS